MVNAATTHSSPLLQKMSFSFTITLDVLIVLGNVLPLLVVWYVKQASQRINFDYIIAAISFMDILSVVIPQPAWLAWWITGYQYDWLCNFHQITQLWFQLTSMLLVVILCLDRVRTVCRLMLEPTPIPADTRDPCILAGLSLLLIMVMLALTMLLPLFGLAPSGGHSCQTWLGRHLRHWNEHVFFLVFAVLSAVCLFGIIVINLFIICMWRQNHRHSKKHQNFQQHHDGQKLHRANSDVSSSVRNMILEKSYIGEVTNFIESMRVVALVSLAFLCTWIPTLVISILRFLDIDISMAVIHYAQLSTSLSGVLCPVIYAACSSLYRHGYKRLLCCYDICYCLLPTQHLHQPLNSPLNETCSFTTNLQRDETTQSFLPTSASMNSCLRQTADYKQQESELMLAHRKFQMHNPSLELQEEVAADNSDVVFHEIQTRNETQSLF